MPSYSIFFPNFSNLPPRGAGKKKKKNVLRRKNSLGFITQGIYTQYLKPVPLNKMPTNGTPVFFLPVYGTKHVHQQITGYTKPKLDVVLCQGIPFSGKKPMSVRPSHKKWQKRYTSVFLPVYGTKNETRWLAYTKLKLDDVFCQGTPFSGQKAISGVACH